MTAALRMEALACTSRRVHRINTPVLRASPVTCLQTAIIELAIKRRNRITDSAFDELCKWHHASRAQTADNYYPRSWWLMKKVAGVEDVRNIQVGTLWVVWMSEHAVPPAAACSTGNHAVTCSTGNRAVNCVGTCQGAGMAARLQLWCIAQVCSMQHSSTA